MFNGRGKSATVFEAVSGKSWRRFRSLGSRNFGSDPLARRVYDNIEDKSELP